MIQADLTSAAEVIRVDSTLAAVETRVAVLIRVAAGIFKLGFRLQLSGFRNEL